MPPALTHMSRARLPLNALRTFEACARHGSFLAAAEELSVTPSALSRQIKALEADLGVRLFERFNRAVRLTVQGERLAEGVEEGLIHIEEAVNRVRPRGDGPLVVSVLHSLASKWLVPRLASLEEERPGFDVLVAASDRAVDLAREGVDVAIRLGAGPYPGLDAIRLARAVAVPVCAPALVRAGLRTPADLADAVLLHDVTLHADEPDWSDFLVASGVRGVDPHVGPRFSNAYMAIDAALAGRGVALVQHALVIDELAAGRLVRPFPYTMETSFQHWALCLPERADDPKIRRFRRWLVEQFTRDGLDAFE